MDRKIWVMLAIILATAGVASPATPAPSHTRTDGPTGFPTPERTRAMQLVWSEEGNGSSGYTPDPALWNQWVTDQWQNPAELQNYTAGNTNAYYDGFGNLVLEAVKEASGGKNYSSARLRSPKLWMNGGVFEARLKVPNGGGIWPAFWLLGQDGQYGWPACGEIDIMEMPASATELGYLHGGTHVPGATNNDVATGTARMLVNPAPAEYHTYAIDWQRDSIEWFYDHKSRGKVTRAMVEANGGNWTFDHRPLSIVLNLAVGGWAGTPDSTWAFQTMTVDYVRVWQ